MFSSFGTSNTYHFNHHHAISAVRAKMLVKSLASKPSSPLLGLDPRIMRSQYVNARDDRFLYVPNLIGLYPERGSTTMMPNSTGSLYSSNDQLTYEKLALKRHTMSMYRYRGPILNSTIAMANDHAADNDSNNIVQNTLNVIDCITGVLSFASGHPSSSAMGRIVRGTSRIITHAKENEDALLHGVVINVEEVVDNFLAGPKDDLDQKGQQVYDNAAKIYGKKVLNQKIAELGSKMELSDERINGSKDGNENREELLNKIRDEALDSIMPIIKNDEDAKTVIANLQESLDRIKELDENQKNGALSSVAANILALKCRRDARKNERISSMMGYAASGLYYLAITSLGACAVGVQFNTKSSSDRVAVMLLGGVTIAAGATFLEHKISNKIRSPQNTMIERMVFEKDRIQGLNATKISFGATTLVVSCLLGCLPLDEIKFSSKNLDDGLGGVFIVSLVAYKALQIVKGSHSALVDKAIGFESKAIALEYVHRELEPRVLSTKELKHKKAMLLTGLILVKNSECFYNFSFVLDASDIKMLYSRNKANIIDALKRVYGPYNRLAIECGKDSLDTSTKASESGIFEMSESEDNSDTDESSETMLRHITGSKYGLGLMQESLKHKTLTEQNLMVAKQAITGMSEGLRILKELDEMKKRDESPEHQKLIKDIQDNSIVAQVVQEVVASRIAVEIHEKQIAECYIKAKDAAIGMMIGVVAGQVAAPLAEAAKNAAKTGVPIVGFATSVLVGVVCLVGGGALYGIVKSTQAIADNYIVVGKAVSVGLLCLGFGMIAYALYKNNFIGKKAKEFWDTYVMVEKKRPTEAEVSMTTEQYFYRSLRM